MARRLSEADRVQLQARREQLQLELRLIEGELRTDEALRLQAEVRRADARLGCAAAGGSGCGDETNRAARRWGDGFADIPPARRDGKPCWQAMMGPNLAPLAPLAGLLFGRSCVGCGGNIPAVTTARRRTCARW